MEHNTQKTYIAIDLKSFYASVECVERKFDPLTTNLVVADEDPKLNHKPRPCGHDLQERPRIQSRMHSRLHIQ